MHRYLEHGKNTWVCRLGDVKAQEAACGLRDAERIARRKDDVLGQRPAGNVRCIESFWKLAPEKHAASWLDPWFDAQCFQPRACLSHRTGQALSQALHVLSVGAVFQHAEDEFARKASAAERGGNLQIDQSLDPVAPHRDKTAAYGRREALGKAADMDDSLKAVERCKTGSGFVLEVAEDTVFDNREARLVRELQKPMRDDRRERCACRVVQRRVGNVETRPMLRKRLRKQVDIGTCRRIRNADDLGAVSTQQGDKIEIAGVIDEYRIAGFEQQAA